jgi:peroxiredoxin
MELEALETIAAGFEEAGASLVAVSPQLEKFSRQIVKKYGLTFPVLSDPGNQVATKFGLTFALPGYLQELYRGFGLDLPRYNGDDSWTLPLPARFIIDSDGVIRDAEVNADYRVRPEPEQTLMTLQNLILPHS